MHADDDDDVDDRGRPDPDSRARTHLANERTFLAWFRTALTLVALGVAASQFLGAPVPDGGPLVQILSLATVGGGVLLATGGYLRYRAARVRIDALQFEPAGRSIELSLALIVVVGLSALAFVAFAARP